MSSATPPGGGYKDNPEDIANDLRQLHQGVLRFDQKMREAHEKSEREKAKELQRVHDDKSIFPGADGDLRKCLISQLYIHLTPMTYEQSAMIARQNLDKAMLAGSERLRAELKDPSRPKMSMEEAMTKMLQAGQEYAELCRKLEAEKEQEAAAARATEHEAKPATPATTSASVDTGEAAMDDSSESTSSYTTESSRSSSESEATDSKGVEMASIMRARASSSKRPQSWPNFENRTPASNPSSTSIKTTALSRSSPNIHDMGK